MDIARIVNLLRLFMLVFPVLLIIAAGICLIRVPSGEKKKSVRARMGKIRENALLWLTACVLYTACFAGISIVQQRLQNSITIGLNYEEASKGLTPNGTRFNSYDIVDDEVLNQAIEDGGLGNISVSELRSTLDVQPLQSEETLSEDQYYMSTEYVLSYEASLKTILLDGKNIVESVANAFYNSFVEEYTRKTDILEIDYTDVDEADYLDKVDILEKQITAVQNYLWTCNTEGQNYVADDNETFASLASKIADYQDVELERLRSYILTKGLSNDSGRQLAKLNYENLIRDISYQRDTADYDVRLETIDMYERDMATIVLVPTTDDEGEFYMSRTKVAVDDFADEADLSSQSAAQTQQEIENNRYAISQLNSASASDDEYETADDMIEAFKATLTDYAERALEMVKDYDTQTSGNYLVVSSNSTGVMQGIIKNSVIVFAGIVVSLALLIAVFPEHQKRRVR